MGKLDQSVEKEFAQKGFGLKNPLSWMLLILLMLLSFIRENFFLVLNGAINKRDSYKANIEIPEFLTSQLSTSELTKLKYVAAILFIIIFSALYLIIIRTLFESKRARNISLYFLLAFVVISTISLGYYTLTDSPLSYFIFIKASHFLQSPLITFLSIPILYFTVNKK